MLDSPPFRRTEVVFALPPPKGTQTAVVRVCGACGARTQAPCWGALEALVAVAGPPAVPVDGVLALALCTLQVRFSCGVALCVVKKRFGHVGGAGAQLSGASDGVRLGAPHVNPPGAPVLQ